MLSAVCLFMVGNIFMRRCSVNSLEGFDEAAAVRKATVFGRGLQGLPVCKQFDGVPQSAFAEIFSDRDSRVELKARHQRCPAHVKLSGKLGEAYSL